jgi:hypothetical protein
MDSVAMCVFATAPKVRFLKELIAETVRHRGSMPLKRLASVVGKLNYLESAFGPAIFVGTRIVSIQIEEIAIQFGWKKSFVILSKDSKSALKRVSRSLESWNGHPIRTDKSPIALTSVLANEDPQSVARKIPNRKLYAGQFTMVSDASDTTVAAYGLEGPVADFMFTQALLPYEALESSTFREMAAILKTLQSRAKALRMLTMTTLWWITDSENVSRIFRRGSGEIVLIRLALQVLEVALKLNLDLHPVWVSRNDPRLQKADDLSKNVNTDDWSVCLEA